MANQREQQRRKCGNAMTAASKEGVQMPSLAIPHGLPMWRPKAQDYVIDLVPYIVPKKTRFVSHNNASPNEWWYERRYFNHPRIGVAGDAIVCPARTFGKPCPICEHKKKVEESLRARGPKVSKQEFADTLSPLNPKERQLFLVYDHGAKSVGVQLWEESFHNFGKQLTQKLTTSRKELRDKLEVFFDPYGGFSLRIVGVEESGGQYKYTKFNVDEFIERKKGLASAIYEHDFCLDTIPVEIPYKDIAKVFSAGSDSKKEEEEEDDNNEEETDDTDDDNEDEDEEDTDNEDEEDADDSESSSEIKKGVSVDFTYKGKERTGKVVKIDEDSDLIHVKCGDRDKPYVVDKDEIQISEAVEDEEEDEDDSDDDSELDDDDEEDEEEDEDDSDDDSELDDDDEEDEEEEDESAPARRGRPKGKRGR